MFGWLQRFGRRKEAPLVGAPEVRRLKTYSAASGYVYEYVYEGHRGEEYVFDVSGDRKTHFFVSVVLTAPVLDGWQQENKRQLSVTELYAVAKIALFQAFDERLGPAAMREPVLLRAEDMQTIAEQLGLL